MPEMCKSLMSGEALLCRAAPFTLNSVKRPLINVEEEIDRVVGRRTNAPDALSMTATDVADSIAWCKAFGGVPGRGHVYRFKTHEEADQWLWRMITRPRN
jgi:hypothetical protein